MSIKFPKMHIATSVVNRILNVADGLPDRPSELPTAPDLPNIGAQGLMLDNALATPPPGELPGIDGAPDPGATVQGAPLLATMLDPKP